MSVRRHPKTPPAAAAADQQASSAETVVGTEPEPESVPRWILYIRTVSGNFGGIVLVGFVVACLAAATTLTLPNVYRARASMLVDNVAARLTSAEQDVEIASGMSTISVPTIEGLLVQPQIARVVLDVIEGVRSGRLPVAGDQPAPPLAEAMAPIDERVARFLAEADLEAMRSTDGEVLLELIPEDLLGMIEVQPRVEKRLAFDVVYSPLIYLEARATSPALARMLANTYLATFVTFFDEEVARRQLKTNYMLVKNQYEEAMRAWESTQTELQEVLTSSELPVVEKLMEDHTAALRVTTQRLLEAQRRLAVIERQLMDTTLKLRATSRGTGEWVGQVTLEGLASNGETTEGEPLLPADVVAALREAGVVSGDDVAGDPMAVLESLGLDAADLGIYERLRRESVRSAKHFVDSTRRLQLFEAVNALEELELRKTDTVARFNEYQRALRSLQIDVMSINQAITAITQQITGIPERLQLQRMIPLDVIYGLHAERRARPTSADGESDGAETGLLAPMSFSEEMLNPVRTRMETTLAEMQARASELGPRLEQTIEALQETADEIQEIQRQLSELRVQQRILRDDQESARETYKAYFDRFNEMRLEYFNTATEVLSLRAEIQQLNERLVIRRAAIEEFYTTILAAGNRRTILESDMQNRRRTTELLQQRLTNLENQLSENSQLIKVATTAIEPQDKIWPPRTLLTVAAGAVAAVIYTLWLLIAAEMQQRVRLHSSPGSREA